MDTITLIAISFLSLLVWAFILRAIFSVGTLVKNSKAQTEFLYQLAAKEDKNQADEVLYRNSIASRPMVKNEQGYVVDNR